MANDQVRHDEAAQRFEMDVNGTKAIAEYQRNGTTLTFTHTEVPTEFRGHGLGSKLARGALDLARADGKRVIPQCPFIAHFIEQNPEYQDLLADG
jgi:predicted GNAT family acetyltransferase